MSTSIPTAHVIPLHHGQRAILNGLARFTVVACGRRFGKTELGKNLMLERALLGEQCWWVAPTYRMAGQVWRDLRRACRRLNVIQRVDGSDRLIDLTTGGSIAIRSAHTADHLRGAGLDFVVLDEAAFMPAALWPEVIRPMLLDRQGSALFLSTPYGRNWFWEIFQHGLTDETGEWRSFRFTSYDNPLLSPDELDAIRRNTPENIFRAEYLAEFLDDAGQVFRGVREAATAPADAHPIAGRIYAAGVDWGRSHDYTAITILDVEAGTVVALDRFREIGWALQRGRLRALCERWSPVVIFAEENSIGSVNIEALQREGLPVRPFKMTAASKAPLIEALALAIEQGQIALPPDETLLNELAAFTFERRAGGALRYSAPSGLHDDTVISLALAWHAARHHSAPISFL